MLNIKYNPIRINRNGKDHPSVQILFSAIVYTDMFFYRITKLIRL